MTLSAGTRPGQRLLFAKRTQDPVRNKQRVVHPWLDELREKIREASSAYGRAGA